MRPAMSRIGSFAISGIFQRAPPTINKGTATATAVMAALNKKTDRQLLTRKLMTPD
jgi:hypothetical protein